MKVAICSRGLHRQFAGVTAVDAIDLEVRVGECFGMLGPNGAGKTTITRMIQAVLPRSGGELTVLGLDPRASGTALRSRIGVVAQGDNLDPDLSAYGNLWIYGRYYGQSRRRAHDSAERWLDFAELSDRRDAKPRELSGGMRRRLMIARAMINGPELLLLDEPTTALDPQARHAVWGWLQRLKGSGLTMLLTTHDMEEAERLCDRLFVIDNGKRLVVGAPDALVQEHVGTATVESPGASEEQVRALAAEGAVAVEGAGDTVLAHFADEAAARQHLDRCLDAGLSASLRRATLEDLFLRLTGRALRQ
jgi:lipooligosaccharide transport system ATP-binding protein